MSLIATSRAYLLRIAIQESAATITQTEGAAAPESEHQNPAWVRRCVASYLHGGGTKKKAPGSLDREGVSKAFAICTAQYKKLEDPEAKDAAAGEGKKAKTRAVQYQKILSKVRKGPKKGG